MPKKILINGITLEGGNIKPLLLKIKNWQELENEITIIGNHNLEKQIREFRIVKNYKFIRIRSKESARSKFRFVLEALRRNFHLLFYIRKLKNKFDVVYNISSVLDMVLLPYMLKKIDKNIIWATVFDNTVPLVAGGEIIAGNKITRILAWIFYKISLLPLRNADCIFVIKPELKEYMLKKSFKEKQLIITGNGVEVDLIKNAKKNNKYKIDALFIGRINEAKGIYDMLKVLKIVKTKYENFQLAIMGRGDEVTEYSFKKRIREMNLENNIHFLGYKTGQEKFNIIKNSKLFLFLSETESVPISPLEAVCSGLKVLAYDIEAYSMYKNNEVMIFKKNDFKSVAKKVIEIFNSNDFENEKGKLLLSKHSWDRISDIEIRAINNAKI